MILWTALTEGYREYHVFHVRTVVLNHAAWWLSGFVIGYFLTWRP